MGDGSTLTAADGVTLEIAEGSSTALVAASGAGKSTLLQLIGAIDTPDEGRITVGELEITALSRRKLADYRASIGSVFQQVNLLPALTVVDNVAAPLVGRRGGRSSRAWAAEILAAVGLADRVDARPDHLSGGQQQRVAIARAPVVESTPLLADELTGNLDSTTAKDILALLAEVPSRANMTAATGTGSS